VNVLFSLGILPVFSLNLILHLGLGMRHIKNEEGENLTHLLYQGAVLFLSILLLWLFFTYILSPLSLGFFEYFLLFPLSTLVYGGLKKLPRRLFPRLPECQDQFSPAEGYDRFVLAALLLTLRLAASFFEALVLSLGFPLGFLGVFFLLREIRRRGALEKVPRTLRGMPLTFISMGFLSLIFSSVSVILLHLLGFY
jgi:electron transport complex protein RnfA